MQEGTIENESLVAKTKTAAIGRADKIKQAAAEKLNKGKEKAKQIHVSGEDYVRAHPTKCVLGALGLGVAIGLIVRR